MIRVVEKLDCNFERNEIKDALQNGFCAKCKQEIIGYNSQLDEKIYCLTGYCIYCRESELN
jgi:hypothetical protein